MRDSNIHIRTTLDTKVRLAKLAAGDRRTVSAYAERVLLDHMEQVSAKQPA